MSKQQNSRIKDALIGLLEKERICALALLVATLSLAPHVWDGFVSVANNYINSKAAAHSLTVKEK